MEMLLLFADVGDLLDVGYDDGDHDEFTGVAMLNAKKREQWSADVRETSKSKALCV